MLTPDSTATTAKTDAPAAEVVARLEVALTQENEVTLLEHAEVRKTLAGRNA